MDYLPELYAMQMRAREFFSEDELQMYEQTIKFAKWDEARAWEFLDDQAPLRYQRDETPPKLIDLIVEYEASLR